jgi:hypothetical protein
MDMILKTEFGNAQITFGLGKVFYNFLEGFNINGVVVSGWFAFYLDRIDTQLNVSSSYILKQKKDGSYTKVNLPTDTVQSLVQPLKQGILDNKDQIHAHVLISDQESKIESKRKSIVSSQNQINFTTNKLLEETEQLNQLEQGLQVLTNILKSGGVI